jgi:16S rRNA (uracil1498-N3)-methyltransferase
MNADRLAAIAIEAAEQCERLTVPQLHAPLPLSSLLSDWPPDRRLFAAIERATAPRIAPAHGPRALLIGPEGGFSPAELDALRSHRFVTPASLGPRILRAETACIAGLALLQGVDCR